MKGKNDNGKKKILIYAHYYYPDVASTGQLLKEQAEQMQSAFDVTVICVVPSYNGTVNENYKTQKYYKEKINGVNVIRIRVPGFTKSDKISRVKNIFTYFLRAIWATFMVEKQDYIFTISQPPILGGLLGVYGKILKSAKLIYCIQDFNPEQSMAVNYLNSKLLSSIMLRFDIFSCKQSALIIMVGRDQVDTLKKRFHGKRLPKYTLINNWINEKEIYPLTLNEPKVACFRNQYGLNDKFVFMYSGNIGLYYDLPGLLKIIEEFKPGTKTMDGREVAFAFVGEGSLLNDLVLYVEKQKMSNVVFIPYQDKENLIYSLNAADVHIVVNAKGIKGISCPSKYYGVTSCGKPVLGILEKGTEIRILIEFIKNGLVSEPGDYTAVKKNIQWFIDNASNKKIKEMGCKGRDYLVKNLSMDDSIKKYINEILNC